MNPMLRCMHAVGLREPSRVRLKGKYASKAAASLDVLFRAGKKK